MKMILDPSTLAHNQFWVNDIGKKATEMGARLVIAIGVLPDGNLNLQATNKIPPFLVVKYLRELADTMERNNTDKIIIPRANEC